MSREIKSWLAPVILALMCVAPFLTASSLDAETLLARLRSGDCAALPLLATHQPEELTLDLMTELAQHREPRVRELVGHQDWIPHINLRAQLAVVATLEPASLRERAMIWITRRTTSKGTLTRDDLASYWKTRKR